MSKNTVTVRQICEQIQDLPEESLPELATYIEFLRFKGRTATSEAQPTSPLRIIKLGGLLKGYDFSPDFIAEARREMWKKFEDSQS